MGNSALQCVSDQSRAARLVYPDGHVESLPKSCTVSELLQKHGPNHFVCNSSPLILKNRMQPDAKFDPDHTYFLCVIPRAADPSAAAPTTAAESRKRIQSQDSTSVAATIRFKSSRGDSNRARANIRPVKLVPSRAGVVGREIRSSIALRPSPSISRRVFDSHATTMWVSTHPGGLEHKADLPQKRQLTKLVFFRRFLSVVRRPGPSTNLSSKGCIKLLSNPHRSSRGEPLQNVVEYKTLQTISDPKIKSISISAISSNVQLQSSSHCGKMLMNESYATIGRRSGSGRTRQRSRSSWKPMLQSISEVTVTLEVDHGTRPEDVHHKRVKSTSSSDDNMFHYTRDPRQRLSSTPSKSNKSSLVYTA